MEIKEWGKVELRESADIRHKVEELEARGLRHNFVLVKQPGSSQG